MACAEDIGENRTMNLDLLDALKAAQCERRPIVLATVIRVAGSTPRRSGASMVIDRDNTVGTIGGGAFEFRVIEDARALLGDPQNETRLVDVHLVRDLGMLWRSNGGIFRDNTTHPHAANRRRRRDRQPLGAIRIRGRF